MGAERRSRSASPPHDTLVRWVALGLFLVTALVFLPAVRNGFVNYDDPDYVTGNEHVQAGLTLDGMRWALTSGDAANWHPLTWVSHMLDTSLFGRGPRGPHAMSIMLHACNAALAFLALTRLTGRMGLSCIAAAWFALHPLRVESVAWISERKDVLSGAFFFLTLWAYARFAAARRAGGPSSARWYVVALAGCALGLMAKPMLVTLPCVLLLLDVWPLQRTPLTGATATRERWARLVGEKLPFFALAGASSVVTYLVQKAGGAVTAQLGLEARLANAIVAVARYCGAIVWPSRLAVLYPHPGHWPILTVMGAALFAGCVTAVVLVNVRRRPWLAVGWCWFLGMLVPVIGLVQVGLQSMADRYTYLPVVGLAVAAVWTGAEMLGGRDRRGVTTWAVLGVLGALAVLSLRQIRVWKTSLTLFDHTIAVAGEKNAMAYNNRGHFQFEQGNYAAAMADYAKALELNPDSPEANNNYGEALARQGRTKEAMAFYQRALRVRPDLAQAHNNVANALADEGALEQAFKEYEVSLRLRPHDANTLNNYGASLAMAGRIDEGQAKIEAALRLSPDYASAHANLGNVLSIKGRRDEALAHYDRALALEPADARTHFNRGNVLLELGRVADAAGSFQRAVQLAPVNPDAHALLGFTFARLGRRDDAVRELQVALQQRPDHPQARAWLQQVQAAR